MTESLLNSPITYFSLCLMKPLPWAFSIEVWGICCGFNIVELGFALLFIKLISLCFLLRFRPPFTFPRLHTKFRAYFTDKILQRRTKLTEFGLKKLMFFKHLNLLKNLFILIQPFPLHTTSNSPTQLMWRHELKDIRLKQQNQLSNLLIILFLNLTQCETTTI